MDDSSPIVAERSIHILQMGKFFLYLPIYYAHHKNFFGFLPSGIKVVIDEPIDDNTDTAAYDQMMGESPDYRDSVMAITDPIQILRTPLNSKIKPAVLATLVTNGGFWAVNHGSHKIGALRDLGVFDRVIAYREGTTSYNIAARIAKDSGVTKPLNEFIHVVPLGKELLLLSDAIAGAGAVALSPDILRIEEMANRKEKDVNKIRIELPIGDTDEYNNVVVTALVSSDAFVANNPDIVRGVVRGIQKALSMTHRADPDVLRYARYYFRYSERAEAALSNAIQSGILPRHVDLAQPHWMSAAKVYYGLKQPNSICSQADEATALEYYHTCIEPYEHFTDDAIKLDGSIPLPPRKPSLPRATLLRFAAIFLAIGITSLLGWIPASIIAVVLLLAWGLVGLVKEYSKQVRVGVLILFWVTGAIPFALPFIEWFGLKEKKADCIFLGLGILLTAIWETTKHVEREKR